jgi:NAD+ kinase
MLNNVLIFVNQRKQVSTEIGHRVANWCQEHDVRYILHSYRSSPLDSDEQLREYQQTIRDQGVDLIVVIGGDGTLLRAGRAFASLGIPVLPVSSGKLAFLMFLPKVHVEAALEEIHKKAEIDVEKRLMLRGSFLPTGRPIFALNEIVVTLEDRTRMAEFSVNIAKTLINTYRADGLIVSTATGSSAYNLSAGGPLVYPANDSIILTPICSHSLSTRPLVLNPEHPIEVSLGEDEHPLTIVADGQEKRQLNPGQTLVIRRSPHDLKLARTRYATSFFEALRDKLDWR